MPSNNRPNHLESYVPELALSDQDALPDQAAPLDQDAAARRTSRRPAATRFPIVGLGASAGGLEALEQFFSHLVPHSGLAFVVVTHQLAGHTSMMPELLSRHTEMPVSAITDGCVVVPDHVYVVPPGTLLAISDGVLRLQENDASAPLLHPIDHFFRSLAQDRKELAIAIVLSGTGTDGSAGIKEIKAASGLVIVQEVESARYSGMPHSAIATGIVDYVCPAVDMPAKLVAFVPGLSGLSRQPPEDAPSVNEEVMGDLFAILHARSGHDFSHYKKATIMRRIDRRMVLHDVASAGEYLTFLRSNPPEVDALFNELLIGVTAFFRDPEAFNALRATLPVLLETRKPEHILRAWVTGCSTGEEAYSLAILLREYLDEHELPFSVQIFATDIDDAAIDVARAAVYSYRIESDVTPERLERYFVREDADSYRVKKVIREMLIFARQNLLQDPPFTKLDILTCRNLLIYLEPELQQKVLPLFHYALAENGILFLGSSESLGASSNFFEPIDKKWKVFRRKACPVERPIGAFPAEGLRDYPRSTVNPVARRSTARTETSVERLAEELFLRKLVPTCALVHERGEIVQLHGRTGLFFELPAGAPSNNIFNMAREGLELPLSSAFRQAGSGNIVTRPAVRVKSNGGYTSVDLRVEQLQEPEPLAGLFLVTFNSPTPALAPEAEVPPERLTETRRVAELENELSYTRDSHQRAVQELGNANLELASSNQELQSTNEELQSANEELETSKEEMQSLNEELQTVNAELHDKVGELVQASDDMRNLLNSTDIATIFLDEDLRIKRFTASATKVVHLINADIGRPLSDLVMQLRYDRVVEDAREVLRTLNTREVEVLSLDDRWYLMRILPYRTADNLINGLVMTFVDVTVAKDAYRFANSIVQSVRNPMLVLNSKLCVLSANRAFSTTFGYPESSLLGTSLFEIGDSTWDILELHRLLNEVLAEQEAVEGFRVTHAFPGLGRMTMDLDARLLDSDRSRESTKILLVFHIVSSGSKLQPGEHEVL